MKNPWKDLSKINPQREDGNTQINKEVFDAIIQADLTASQYKIVLFVIRKTYGFNKKSDTISYSQFIKATGLSRRMVILTIQALRGMRIINYTPSLRVQPITPLDKRVQRGSPLNEYLFNKHYDTWLPRGERVQPVTPLEGCNPVSEKGAIQCKKGVQPIAPTKDTSTKDTLTKDISDEEPPEDENPPEEKPIPPDQEIIQLKSRYSHDQKRTVDKCIGLLATTRKYGKIADSVIIAQLKLWQQHPTRHVIAGMKKYIKRRCAEKGKREAYLAAIISNISLEGGNNGSNGGNPRGQKSDTAKKDYGGTPLEDIPFMQDGKEEWARNESARLQGSRTV